MTRDLSIDSWLERRTFDARSYSPARLLAAKLGHRVTVLLPARDVEATLGSILEVLLPFQSLGLIDELVVIDSSSTDASADVARAHGVEVHHESGLRPEFGPSRGKGDALWRGLSVTGGDIVLFFDTDTQNFGEGFFLGMLGPLLEDPNIRLLKGAFHRPLQVQNVTAEEEGGRVTELVARSLINLYLPQLAGFVQPLAGEVGARRSLLERLSFPVGYGVEIAMLVDALELEGLDALAQVNLGERRDTNKRLRELVPMAATVIATFVDRVAGNETALRPHARLLVPGDMDFEVKETLLEERPPLIELVPRQAEET